MEALRADVISPKDFHELRYGFSPHRTPRWKMRKDWKFEFKFEAKI